MLAAALPTAFASLVDERAVPRHRRLGQAAEVRVRARGLYCWTLAFFARFLPAGTTAKRWYRIYVGAVAVAIVLEMIWIGGAAALGTASHFNRTPIRRSDLCGDGLGRGAPDLGHRRLCRADRAQPHRPACRRRCKDAVVIGLALVLPLTLVTAGTMAAMGAPFRRRIRQRRRRPVRAWAGRATAATCASRISSPPTRCTSSRRSALVCGCALRAGEIGCRSGCSRPPLSASSASCSSQALTGRAVPALARVNGLESRLGFR